jgi:hypothetical protein
MKHGRPVSHKGHGQNVERRVHDVCLASSHDRWLLHKPTAPVKLSPAIKRRAGERILTNAKIPDQHVVQIIAAEVNTPIPRPFKTRVSESVRCTRLPISLSAAW